MKKILFLITACFVFISCGMNTKNETKKESHQEVSMKNDCVEVLYFHGKQRCATCIAIENNTKKAVEENFSEQLNSGKVVFRIIDISQSENESIAEKYEVTWSSLFIVNHKNGNETTKNMTEFAFGNARKSPELFIKGVTDEINNMIKHN